MAESKGQDTQLVSQNWRNVVGKSHTNKPKKEKNGVLSGYYCHEKKSDIKERTEGRLPRDLEKYV